MLQPMLFTLFAPDYFPLNRGQSIYGNVAMKITYQLVVGSPNLALLPPEGWSPTTFAPI